MALKPTAPEFVSNNPALLTFAALVGTAGQNAFPRAGVDEVALAAENATAPAATPSIWSRLYAHDIPRPTATS
jgi:hypothetical protein